MAYECISCPIPTIVLDGCPSEQVARREANELNDVQAVETARSVQAITDPFDRQIPLAFYEED